MIKKILSIVFCFLMFGKTAYAYSAQSYVLIERYTGRILLSSNEKKPLPMASTTKIMTALVALSVSNPDDIVTVSANASKTEGSSMYLKAGEKVSMRELLYGLMLSSGNDAAVAIAEHIGGSTENFAKTMTDKAREIGAMQTTFKNPNGLDEQGHETTALDLAKITAYAMQNPLFCEIASTKQITLTRGTYTNHNKLLRFYKGVCGVKTGYTKKDGRCLVSACERNGFSLIAVTLNAPDDWNDHMSMYDYAYADYQLASPVTDGTSFGTTATDTGESIELLYKGNLHFYLSTKEQKRLEIVNNVPAIIPAPIYCGQVVGSSAAYLDGQLLGKCEIISNTDVSIPEKTFNENLYHSLCLWLGAFR